MASLVYGFGKAVNCCFLNRSELSSYSHKEGGNTIDYNPQAEVLGTLLKVGVAVWVFFVFHKLMPQNSAPEVAIATGALLYKGLINTVGPQITDLAVAGWLASPPYLASKVDLKQAGILLARYGMALAVFLHIFSRLENVKNMGTYLDRFSTVTPFSGKTHSVWPYISKFLQA